MKKIYRVVYNMNQVYNTRDQLDKNSEFLYRISNSVNPSRADITLNDFIRLPNIRNEYNFNLENDKYELKYMESRNRISLYYGKKNSSIVDLVKKMKKTKKQLIRQPSILPSIRNNTLIDI